MIPPFYEPQFYAYLNGHLRACALNGSGQMCPHRDSAFDEATSNSADTDFLEGYISEQDYARRRGVTLRTCQRDRQLRKAPPYTKLGRDIFYRVEAVREWLVKNERIANQTLDTSRSPSLRNPYPLPRGMRQRPQTGEIGEGRRSGR